MLHRHRLSFLTEQWGYEGPRVTAGKTEEVQFMAQVTQRIVEFHPVLMESPAHGFRASGQADRLGSQPMSMLGFEKRPWGGRILFAGGLASQAGGLSQRGPRRGR